ncbi:molybdate ABC transporter substrate-binding protein [Ramlibacter alkalitolerans]|jgi:molybdate transport system substrate-binding protein|uniref:Molybdate ABC transporter substrate-binding protein n=1 Tax=Ramlibacter alkalitolerans TaxID=2039631 RepID=A0ABS1JNB0_9BURK|nr:molybdate ABC transporter substrate-binding protein [Ramlibacter alkalitolerans]MBL0425737.1 molybdate ABC transporter substrate-binding protein [Ramlibacter alkalitolerans]
MSHLHRAIAFTATLLAAGLLQAGQVRVAVAANMAIPMQRIAVEFERATGHELIPALGSTGRFYSQLRGGAPFEVLLAADDEIPARLEREGLAVPGSRFTYAVGRLVLWSLDPHGVDPQGNVLKQLPRGRLAIADPRLSPYGAAAIKTLGGLGVLAAWQPAFLQGESVSQAFQFVASGNASYGFLALSQVMRDGRIPRGSGWIVPSQYHPPLNQDVVLLNGGRSSAAALAFLDYLKSEPARATLRGFGYEVVKH